MIGLGFWDGLDGGEFLGTRLFLKTSSCLIARLLHPEQRGKDGRAMRREGVIVFPTQMFGNAKESSGGRHRRRSKSLAAHEDTSGDMTPEVEDEVESINEPNKKKKNLLKLAQILTHPAHRGGNIKYMRLCKADTATHAPGIHTVLLCDGFSGRTSLAVVGRSQIAPKIPWFPAVVIVSPYARFSSFPYIQGVVKMRGMRETALRRS